MASPKTSQSVRGAAFAGVSVLFVAALCVGSGARAGDAAKIDDISGRWVGGSYQPKVASADCKEGLCPLTLDLAPCGEGICGVEVSGGTTCGHTALELKAKPDGGPRTLFVGKLALINGTEPYTVEVFLLKSQDEAPVLRIIGDTGGEFHMMRRSFPFSTTLSRAGDAVCKSEKQLSDASGEGATAARGRS